MPNETGGMKVMASGETLAGANRFTQGAGRHGKFAVADKYPLALMSGHGLLGPPAMSAFAPLLGGQADVKRAAELHDL
jgi:hypothetical protein